MKKTVIFMLVCATVIMNIVDLFIQPGYFIKSGIKLVLFFLLPCVYLAFSPKDRFVVKKLFRFDKKSLKLSLLLAIVCYLAIVSGYLISKNIFDFSAITGNLADTVGVTADNFLFVSIYIALCNSLVEEFLFRGFGFMVLKEHISRNTAFLFSCLLFAFYHIGMTMGWVDIVLYLLGFVGLVTGGMIFNILVENTNSIFSSWIVHMFINFGINTVGFMLFGII